MTLVPEAQRRIYTFKALQADGEGLIQDILGFLEIEQIPLSLSHDNPNAEFRSRALHRQKQRLAPKVRRLKAMLGVRKNLGLGRLLTGWNSKKTARAAISPELVAELRDVFREDYETVKSITGFDIRDSTASFKKINEWWQLRRMQNQPFNARCVKRFIRLRVFRYENC